MRDQRDWLVAAGFVLIFSATPAGPDLDLPATMAALYDLNAGIEIAQSTAMAI